MTKDRKQKKKFGINITIYFTILISLVIILTIAAASAVAYVLNYFFNITLHISENGWVIMFSVILGVAVAIFVSKILLSPIKKLATAMKKVALRDFTVRLETRSSITEVRELYDNFNLMTSELGATEILQTDFVSNVSHEFKTPLISIRGFAKLLQNDDLTSEQRRTYTDTVVQQSERLAAMSTHVLELARYENTEIVSDKTLYSLDEQLRRCVRQQEREWLKKSLTVEGDLDPVDYYGNEELVEHIWSNLLSNAIRFTPAGGQITVVLRRGEGEVTVSVSDTGIGMDEETQRHIFDRFYRAAPYPDDRGNGLGLSIVRRVVTLCGGRVTVFSRPGNGSTFTVTLPAEE